MQAQADKKLSSSGKQSFTTRFKDEIKLAKLFRESTTINELLNGLKQEMRNYFGAEAFTIYFADNKKQQLVSKVKTGRLRKEIRLPINKTSISGYVASTGSIVNIFDAYDESELTAIDPELEFNRKWDDKTKFTTRQVLSAPIFYQKKLFGVIQLINSKSGNKFTNDDVESIKSITDALGLFIEGHLPGTARNQSGKVRKLKSGGKKSAPYKILVKNGLISENELSKAINKADNNKKDIEKVLIDDFELNRIQLGKALAQFYGISFENLDTTIYNPIELIKGKNIDFFLRGLWVPLHTDNNELILAINDPLDSNKIQEVQQLYRTPKVELRFALKEDIKQFLRSFRGAMKTKGSEKSMGDILDDLKHMDTEPSMDSEVSEDYEDVNDNAVVLLVRKIIEDANNQMASDIHIEPYGHEKDAVVRYRIDGRLQNSLTVPSAYIRAVVSRIKILAKMDIAEKRKPQDGKIRFRTTSNKIVELRVATLPTTRNNEDVVLRLLANRFRQDHDPALSTCLYQ
jgi:putative methionine-R-sulfoxide reductase with GAF domain